MTERMIELERADAKREALEHAANKLESYATNDLYAKALKLAAKLVRSVKDEILPRS
jgi:nitroimidazol reductase NimA-like FMN-containing flavoprotein (pyridoxamine 5'-phosphate oxidase superfamily)